MIEVICTSEIPHNIIGNYSVLPQKGRFDECVYEKYDKSCYIYKISKTQYVIANQLNSSVFKAYCTGHDLLSKDGWIIKHDFMDWKYYRKMHIKDIQDQDTTDSTQNMSIDYAEKIIIYSKHIHVNGGYLKTTEKTQLSNISQYTVWYAFVQRREYMGRRFYY